MIKKIFLRVWFFIIGICLLFVICDLEFFRDFLNSFELFVFRLLEVRLSVPILFEPFCCNSVFRRDFLNKSINRGIIFQIAILIHVVCRKKIDPDSGKAGFDFGVLLPTRLSLLS